MVFSYGSNSMNNLSECDNRIVIVCMESIKYFNSSVVCGWRGKEAQNDYFDRGVSKVKWPNSKHNVTKFENDFTVPASQAVDLYPWHSRYGSLTEDPSVVKRIVEASRCTASEALEFIRGEYLMQAMSMKIAAQITGVEIRWGGDWDGDTDRLDQTFHDLAHFELL